MIHELKVLQDYFDDVLTGKKRFELRRDDRDYQVGDIFILKEWTPDGGYTGRQYSGTISYILRGCSCPGYGLADGYCIFCW
ncbi:MAG: DUF3850 domain-containing protein [Lachnospiraceae bacterium]